MIALLVALADPFAGVMDTMREHGAPAARAQLEQVARNDVSLSPNERAHAFRWAAQLAIAAGDERAGGLDLLLASGLAPRSFDGEMAHIGLADMAIAHGRLASADRYLDAVSATRDPIVRVYVEARRKDVRERRRRWWVRAIAWPAWVLASAWLVRVTVRARSRWDTTRWSRVLLASEAVALGTVLGVHRGWTALATPGTTLWAIPTALCVATAITVRLRPVSWMMVGVWAVSGGLLALEYTWWSAGG